MTFAPEAIEQWRVQHVMEQLFVTWNQREGPRGGLHASSILNDVDFCYREHILGTFYQREVSVNSAHLCAIFLDGWITHEKWQDLFTMALDPQQQQRIEGIQERVAAFFEEMFRILLQREPELRDLLQPDIQSVKDQTLREKWQFLFSEQVSGIADEVEQSHYMEEWGLSFTPDAVIQLKKPKTGVMEPFIVEIKGYNKTAYEDILTRSDPMGNAEFKKAAVQANLYMHMLHIEKAIILIENKGDQNFQTWVRKYDPAMAEPYVTKLENIKKLIKMYRRKQLLPQRLPECGSIDGERAQKCPLRTVCFARPEDRPAYAL